MFDKTHEKALEKGVPFRLHTNKQHTTVWDYEAVRALQSFDEEGIVCLIVRCVGSDKNPHELIRLDNNGMWADSPVPLNHALAYTLLNTPEGEVHRVGRRDYEIMHNYEIANYVFRDANYLMDKDLDTERRLARITAYKDAAKKARAAAKESAHA
jgi:hypothetical protein